MWEEELQRIDTFYDIAAQFESDVHMLILGTLDAASKRLNEEAEKQQNEIAEHIPKAKGFYADHLAQEHADIGIQTIEQERFLRNMALVALASRLIHSLNEMARSAETFCERKKKYGNEGMSEFDRLWVEYNERFGLDFAENAAKIAFSDEMRQVRNQIVHAGGEAKLLKPMKQIEADTKVGNEGEFFDTKFVKKFPQYVQDYGSYAEVDVKEELLDNHIKASIELVKWLAGELRRRQLAHYQRTKDVV